MEFQSHSTSELLAGHQHYFVIMKCHTKNIAITAWSSFLVAVLTTFGSGQGSLFCFVLPEIMSIPTQLLLPRLRCGSKRKHTWSREITSTCLITLSKITQMVLFISRHVNKIQPVLTFLEMPVPFVIIQDHILAFCFLNQCNVHLFLYLQKRATPLYPSPSPQNAFYKHLKIKNQMMTC